MLGKKLVISTFFVLCASLLFARDEEILRGSLYSWPGPNNSDYTIEFGFHGYISSGGYYGYTLYDNNYSAIEEGRYVLYDSMDTLYLDPDTGEQRKYSFHKIDDDPPSFKLQLSGAGGSSAFCIIDKDSYLDRHFKDLIDAGKNEEVIDQGMSLYKESDFYLHEYYYYLAYAFGELGYYRDAAAFYRRYIDYLDEIGRSSAVAENNLEWAEGRITEHTENYVYSDDTLMDAVYEGNITLVKEYIRRGADLEAESYLVNALTGGHEKIAFLLIENGVDMFDVGPDWSDWYGYTTLMAAAEGGCVEMVQYLVRHGADVNARERKWNEPVIQFAAVGADTGGHEARAAEVLKALINAGADPNGSFEAFHFACRAGYYDLAALMIKKGVDVNIPDDWGASPLEAASEAGQRDIVELLLQNGAVK